jgi:hypothetical protein
MNYDPTWEQLPVTLMRVIATCGLSKEQAQIEICRAIADRAVRIWIKPRMRATTHTTVSETLVGDELEIPTELNPEDFDWEASRPVNPWLVRRGKFRPAGHWHLAWIKLFSADVTSFLCAAKVRVEATSENAATGACQPAPPGLRSAIAVSGAAGSARRRGRRPQKFEQTCDAMGDDIQQGRCTATDLKEMLEKVLVERYGVSRDTARRARAAVLSEIGSREFSTKAGN